MIDRRKRLLFAGGVFAGLFVTLAYMFFVVARIAIPEANISSISHFQSRTNAQILDLPIGILAGKGLKSVSGSLVVPQQIVRESDYVYIPKFEGILNIKFRGYHVFSGVSPPFPGRSGAAFFPVPKGFTHGGVLQFQLVQSGKKYILLSKIYIADKAALAWRFNLLNIMSNSGLLLLFGLNIGIVFRLSKQLTNRDIGIASAPAWIVSIYMLLLSVDAFGTGLPLSMKIIESVLMMFPLLIGNLWLIGRSQCSAMTRSQFWTIQTVAGICGLLCFGAKFIILDVDVFLMAAFLATLGLLAVGLENLWRSVIRRDVYLAVFAVGILMCCAAIGHDASIRLGFFQQDIYLVFISKVIFILLCALFHRAAPVPRTCTTPAQVSMNSFQDIPINGETAKTLERQAAAREKQRIQEELHDGVMGHLSVISALTEDRRDGDGEIINRASRLASYEIRMILEGCEDGNITLMHALLNFQRYYLDRLAQLDVRVDFKATGLTDMQAIDHKIVADVIRILQEAVHNAVMRAHCKTLSILAEPVLRPGSQDHRGFRIRVENAGGKAFDAAQTAGKGIENMRLRARRIGADFQITAQATGAVVLITWSQRRTIDPQV